MICILKCAQWYRVMVATDPQQVLKTFDTKSPIEIEIKAVFRVDDPTLRVLEIRNRYRTWHVRNEWYALTPTDLMQIEAYCKAHPDPVLRLVEAS